MCFREDFNTIKYNKIKVQPLTIIFSQRPFAVVIIWQTEAEGGGKGRLVVVFSHNQHRAQLPDLLTDHHLAGGKRRHVVVDILHHNNDCSYSCL